MITLSCICLLHSLSQGLMESIKREHARNARAGVKREAREGDDGNERTAGSGEWWEGKREKRASLFLPFPSLILSPFSSIINSNNPQKNDRKRLRTRQVLHWDRGNIDFTVKSIWISAGCLVCVQVKTSFGCFKRVESTHLVSRAFPLENGRKKPWGEFKSYSIGHSRKKWTRRSTEKLVVSLSSSLFPHLKKISLRRQPTFHDAITGFHTKWRLKNRAQKFHTDNASLPRSG